MKHLFLALGLATAVGTAARAQVTYNLLWDKTHGGSDRDWNAQVSTDGKGFLYVIGDSQTNGNGDKTSFLCTDSAIVADIWLVKTDGTGSIVGQNAYGGYGDERSPHLFHLGNAAGEMIFACQSASDTGCTKSQFNRDTIFPFSTDYWVVKLDSNLNPIWDKTLGGMGFDNLTRITQLTNGNILVCGQSQSGVDGDKTVPNHSLAPDFWAVLLDANGNKLNDFVYGGDGGEYLASVIALPGGGFLIGGSTDSDSTGDVSQHLHSALRDYWMIRLDAAGNKVWDRLYGGSHPDEC